MDRKVYEKTRYQNIYRHKSNKNYIVMISKPVKTSISRFNGEKIYDKDTALKVRDNPKIRMQKAITIGNKDDFDAIWNRYIDFCKTIDKLADKTILKKTKAYNSFLKGKLPRITKIDRNYMVSFIEKLNTTDKQKNQTMKELKAFFNWCIKEQIILFSPLQNVKNYKVEKKEMKYWTPEDIKTFFKGINKDLKDLDDPYSKETLYRTKMLFLISFVLGDRTGETAKLKFSDFDDKKLVARIKGTKTDASDRIVDVPESLIMEINNYRYFLENYLDYDILDNEFIFANHKNKMPLSDVTLRKHFKLACQKYNVPIIRMYDLRHTYATMMMNENIETYLFSTRMGHSNIKTTIDKYGHIPKQKRKEIAKITDKFLYFEEKSE